MMNHLGPLFLKYIHLNLVMLKLLDLIHKNPITPNNLWYIRNHHPVPNIKPEDYKLEIFDRKNLYKSLSLEDLKKCHQKK